MEFLRHVRIPIGKKALIVRVRVGRHIGTLLPYDITGLRTLQGAQHTSRVKTVDVVPFGMSYWRTEQAGINS